MDEAKLIQRQARKNTDACYFDEEKTIAPSQCCPMWAFQIVLKV